MRRFATAGAAILFLIASPELAYPVGGGAKNTTGQSTGAPKTKAEPAPTCKKGYVYSLIRKKCVKTLSEMVPDEQLKAQGWALADAGDYEAALELFKLVSTGNDPEALNGLGYTNRKLGRLDIGIAYYQQALAIDPGYVRAREYLGEGYVAAGKVELAKAQLDEIGKRCGSTCEEYVDLAQAILTGTID